VTATVPARRRPLSRARRVLTVLALSIGLASLGTMVAPGAPAAVTAAGWTAMDPPDPLVPNGGLSAVSCVATMCMAVGGSNAPLGLGSPLAEIRGSDGRWNALAVPAPPVRDGAYLAAVSCAAPDSCVAVGTVVVERTNFPLAERWDGRTWTLTSFPAGTAGALASISCPTTTMCMAVGQQGATPITALAARWDGQSWTTSPLAAPDPKTYSASLTGVSCASATSCLATGTMSTDTRSVFAEAWAGQGWTLTDLPGAVTRIDAVSCPGPASCTAIGQGGQIPSIGPMGLHWNGSSWSVETIDVPADLPASSFTGLSCPSAAACWAVGGAATPPPSLEVALVGATWNGQRWSVERLPTPPGTVTAVRGVSCITGGNCTTVGSTRPDDAKSPNGALAQTFAERRASGSWTIETTPDPLGPNGSVLTDVSCPPAGPCMTVGSSIDADGYGRLQSQTWNGAAWTPVDIVTPDGTNPRFSGVSCATTASCTAVGTLYRNDLPFPFAEEWDGQRWSLQSVPLPFGFDNAQLSGVSCSSPVTCVAVGTAATGTSGAGRDYIARWNGLTWTAETLMPPYRNVTGLTSVSCPTLRTCTALGVADTDAGWFTFAVRWDAGSVSFEQVTPPSPLVVNGLVTLSCDSDEDCMAIGTDGHPPARRNVNGWHDTAPVARPFTDTGAALVDVSCLAGACVAVGSYEQPTATNNHPIVETWDGNSWTIQPVANEDPARGRFLGVSCTTTCVAVGDTANTLAATGPTPVVQGATTAAPPVPPPTPTLPGTIAVAGAARGYWALGSDGHAYNFGDAAALGNATAGAVDLEPTPSGKGYWILNRTGTIGAFGDAAKLGDVPAARLANGEAVASLSATPSGRGYWIFTNRGRVLTFGDAPFLGDMTQTKLNGPVLGSVATPTGKGYYMVASDGGIFAFGDAAFAGSMGGHKLNAPVQSLVPDGDGHGYWLVAADGGIFAFDAPFRGSMGGTALNKPVVGMVRYGDGYLMVGADGGIFNFSTSPFAGSLGDKPPASPVVAVAALP
jgi:hypothetical protein